MVTKKGVLLINLGTPDTPGVKDVKKYLAEFLMDERVIDINPIMRRCLVKGLIIPLRSPRSAKLYAGIWHPEFGSPLLYYSIRQQQMLQAALGDAYHVELGMRYQNPGISEAMDRFKAMNIYDIQVIALFPQYAEATSGSVQQKVWEIAATWPCVPNITFTKTFFDNRLMIEAIADRAGEYNLSGYHHVLFSFHGLPQRQLQKCDISGNYCLKKQGCCENINAINRHCYGAQSHHTAKLIADRLEISKEKYTVSFQSRLGRVPWITPYTSDVIKELALTGKRRVLVFSPAFVTDCLETLHEISVEYADMFKDAGGHHLQLVESLNDSPIFIQALAAMLK